MIPKRPVQCSSQRLYYLEQFTSGDVKELVRSCDYRPPDKGYREARCQMKKKFGDDYRVASAYESKALNWPGLKAEDSTALNRFSIFLMRSRYCTEAHHEVTFQYEKNMAPFGGH